MSYDPLLGKPKARPAPRPESKPLPRLCDVLYVQSGCIIIGNAEYRLERFDEKAWVITFIAEWNDSSSRVLCWKVYPARQNESLAIEALRRKASDYGIERIGILCVDRPANSTGKDEEE